MISYDIYFQDGYLFTKSKGHWLIWPSRRLVSPGARTAGRVVASTVARLRPWFYVKVSDGHDVQSQRVDFQTPFCMKCWEVAWHCFKCWWSFGCCLCMFLGLVIAFYILGISYFSCNVACWSWLLLLKYYYRPAPQSIVSPTPSVGCGSSIIVVEVVVVVCVIGLSWFRPPSSSRTGCSSSSSMSSGNSCSIGCSCSCCSLSSTVVVVVVVAVVVVVEVLLGLST